MHVNAVGAVMAATLLLHPCVTEELRHVRNLELDGASVRHEGGSVSGRGRPLDALATGGPGRPPPLSLTTASTQTQMKVCSQ